MAGKSKAPKTALASGVVPQTPERTRYTLPSGATADLRAGKGRDIVLATRMVGDSKDEVDYMFALAAVKILVNGCPVTIEEIYEMTDDDAATLLAIVQGRVLSDAQKEEAKAKSEAARNQGKAPRPKPEGNEGEAARS